MRRLAALGLASAALLALPAAANAHAVLVDTSPERGASETRAPERVLFRFNEPVEMAFGSVRVFDAQGERVDAGEAGHPEGDGRAVAVGVQPDLPDGGYTATYRVVSADGHPVSGGFVFNVGGGGGTAAAVADVLDRGDAGPFTDTAFGAAKAASYAAIAVAVGGVVFLLAVWLPALRGVAGAGERWRLSSESFATRLRTVGAATIAVGALVTALGIILQAAEAAGGSFWDALEPGAIGDVLGTRFGTIWGLRLLDWGLLGVLLGLAWSRQALPALRPASLGATGLAAPPLARGPLLGPLVLLLGFLVVSPALAGHAGASEPRWLLAPADTIHVAAMSVWIGGLTLILLALPAATGRLDGPDRTRLLAASLARFSPLALAAVLALLATGILQSVIHLSSFGDLLDTAFGRAILVKAALMLGLIALGALNRRRSLPRLERIAAEGGAPGAEGVLLRRTLRGEIVLLAAVLAATAALTSYPPPDSLAAGPFSTTSELGPARLELTVDPASVGANEIHLYLTDPRGGAQYDRVRELDLQLRLPEKEIGPLEPSVDKAGPGHWVARRAQIVPGGDWELAISGRVSQFEEHRARVEVPIE